MEPTWRRNLSIRVDMTEREVKEYHKSVMKQIQAEYRDYTFEYYKIYLQHLFPERDDIPFEKMIKHLKTIKETVEFRLSMPDISEQMMVRRLLYKNVYISKNTNRPGLEVKLFHTSFQGRDVIVKTYLYDHNFYSLHYTLKMNFINEAVFQLYSHNFQRKIPVITPELYSWGILNVSDLKKNKYTFTCRFLIMEYIPHITLKEATFTAEHIRNIYQRVKEIDEKMKGELLHHNDLHSGNIMVTNDSPLPDIVILDFGESSLGPRRVLYR